MQKDERRPQEDEKKEGEKWENAALGFVGDEDDYDRVLLVDGGMIHIKE